MTVNTARAVTNRRFGQRQITLSRTTLGVGAEGRVTTSYADSIITALVQPASSDDLNLLASKGMRLTNISAIWSTVELWVSNGKDHDSDVLTLEDGRKFTVLKLFDRRVNGFFKVLAEGYVTP